MVGHNYPDDWDQRCRKVLERDSHQCVNCHTVGGVDDLQVHHIVPVGQAGTHALSNLVSVCPKCHRAAHRQCMAPRVKWYSKNEMSDTEFQHHRDLWQQMRSRLGVPRFDPEEECVYVPVADTDRIVEGIPM